MPACAALAPRVRAFARRANPFKPLTADQARIGIQCAVAIAAGCLFCVIDSLWTGLLRTGTWVIVTVLVVLEPNVGTTLRKSWLRVVGTALGGFGSIAMLEIAYAAGGGKDWENNSVPIAATITVLQSVVGALLLVWKVQHPARSYAYLVTSFTLPIVWVPGIRAEKGQEVVDAIRRLVSILIGIGIACIVQLVVLPVFARRQLTEGLAAALEDSVGMLLTAAGQARSAPRRAAAAGGAGGAGAYATSVQRAQRKVAKGLDKLLEPAATELRLLPGPLSLAAFGSLVDAVAVVGSTAVGLSAALEAAHTDVTGACRHPLPPELEWQLDAAAAALAATFALLADRIRSTLEGCCLQRHHWENHVFLCCRPPRWRTCRAPAGGTSGATACSDAGSNGGGGGGAPGQPAALSPGAALAAAAARCRGLASGHAAARAGLAPSESDLCVAALGACLVLLQQAQAVAAVLGAAGVLEGGDGGEVVTRHSAGGGQEEKA